MKPREGLMKSEESVLAVLRAAPRHVPPRLKVIAAEAGLSHAAYARSVLRRLSELGLVEYVPCGPWRLRSAAP